MRHIKYADFCLHTFFRKKGCKVDTSRCSKGRATCQRLSQADTRLTHYNHPDPSKGEELLVPFYRDRVPDSNHNTTLYTNSSTLLLNSLENSGNLVLKSPANTEYFRPILERIGREKGISLSYASIS